MYQTNITSATLLTRQVKVRTLQYKVTMFLFALVLFVFWPQLVNTYEGFQSSKKGYEDLKQVHADVERQYAGVLKDLKLLTDISTPAQRNTLIQCYNANCSNLPDGIKDEPVKSAVKAYLQLQKQTDNTKFTFDQKKLLIYLNEFLVKSSTDSNTLNGTIKSISFGGVNPAVENTVVVPTTVTLSFPNKQGLLGFLRNIEQYISPVFPMLAVVNSVTYDIVNADSTQDVSVSLDIYMLD